MDSGWSAIWNTSNPWVDSSQFPHFPKIGRLTAPVGYICWDFLFYVVVGLSGWTIWQDPFDDFTNLTRPSVKGGHWLSIIFIVGQRQGWSSDICDAVEAALLQRNGRREQEEEEVAFPFEITPVAGY